jgi:copper chaperone CopZ
MSVDDQRTYNVTGKICEHCAAAVDAQLSRLSCVSAVNVDLLNGVVVVQGSAIDGEAVRGAVRAVRYDLTEYA